MKPRLLVIGGSHDQAPMIRHGRQLGCHVLVADVNPTAAAASLADEILAIDTSDHPALIAAARQHRIAGVCTMATNLGPRSVSAVAHALGLPAISADSALKATDKHFMKEACRAAALAVAAGSTCSEAAEAVRVAAKIGYPVLLKAADASGCRGIEPAYSAADILACFCLAQRESRNGQVVVERYYPEARVIGVESLIHNNHTEVIFSAEKIVRRLPRISTAGVSMPTIFDTAGWALVKQKLCVLHQALGMHMGASHVDMVEVDHDWLVIDVGPRLGGGPMIHHLAPKLTGVDMVDFVIRQSLGENPRVSRVVSPGVGVERFLYTSHSGRLLGYTLPEYIPADLRLEWRKPPGCVLRADGPNVERLGCISLVATALQAAETQVHALAAGIVLEIEQADGSRLTVSPEVLAAEMKT